MSTNKLLTSNVSPFLGVGIGSTISGNGQGFSAPIINAPISKMSSAHDVQKSMTGASSYVYTDTMNQGTFGVSGSYGISGVEKLNTSLSGYVGNSAAHSTKNVNVNFNVSMLSGIEYIDFDNLTAEDVLNSLSKAPKNLATDVLDKFNIVNRKLQGRSTLEALVDAPLSKEINDWVKSLQKFVSKYGDGIVVGIIWGGVGTVSMEMSANQQEDNWKYGGNALFSYSGIGTSVAVKSAYDGGQSHKESDVSVTCSSWSSGKCVADQVDKWFDEVKGTSLQEIGDVRPLEKAPSLNTVSAAPDIPEFTPPKKDSTITDKIKEIKDLEGLQTFATASAYEKAKEQAKAKGKELTLQEFINMAGKNASTTQINKLDAQVKTGDFDVIEEKEVPKSCKSSTLVQFKATSEKTVSADTPDKDYAVLGTWITNWSDIFPWMSTGYLNEITDTDIAESLLRKQCMMQDLLALSGIYYSLESSNIDLTFCGIESALQVANSFASAQSALQETIHLDNAIEQTFNGMIKEAQVIYKKWNEIKFLRGAELCLGLQYKRKFSISDVVEKVVPGFYSEIIYKSKYCAFSGHEFDTFAEFLNLIPVIGANGKVYAYGPSEMFLKDVSDTSSVFTKGGITALEFAVDNDNKTLKNGDIQLYPIPFSAAKNIRWRGQNCSSNLASIPNITEQLKSLKDDLKKLNVCTFSSEDWDSNWNYESAYNLRSIKTQYIGMVDKIGNIFS